MGKQNGEAPLVQTANLPKLMSLPTFKNDSLPVIYKRNVDQPRLGYLHKPAKGSKISKIPYKLSKEFQKNQNFDFSDFA